MAESEAGERPPCCSQSRAAASCSRPGYSSPRSSALNLQQVRRVRELQGSSIVQLKDGRWLKRSEEHTSELQSLMRISYAVFCLKKKKIPRSHLKNYTHKNDT